MDKPPLIFYTTFILSLIMLHRKLQIAFVLGCWIVQGFCPWTETACFGAEPSQETNRYNVLFIAVDDLRPELGCYGVSYIRSPNIDRLAETGRRFTHHYVQVPTCGASRYALLTGRSPFESNATSNDVFFSGSTALRPTASEEGAQTMPELFRRSGYHTALIGKISHQPDGKVFQYDGTGNGQPELPDAWDELLTPYGPWNYGWGAFFAYAEGQSREGQIQRGNEGRRTRNEISVYEMPEVSDNALPDGMMADTAIETLKRLADQKKPFFFGVGFYKPHLPFVAPKRYWDMYEGVDIPLPPERQTDTAYGTGSGEFFQYQMSFPKRTPLTSADAYNVKRAYAACVSYVDAQIGRVLDTLTELRLDQTTIVVLWADHGWHLGEHNVWGKQTLFERSLRSPLIVRVPGMASPGVPTDALVETLDIFPTLRELCSPSYQKTLYPQAGTSFAAALQNPNDPGKSGAYARYSGRTLRTAEYRILARPNPQGGFRDVELYDHRTDPDEEKNIAEDEPETTRRLLERLHTPHSVP